MVVRALIIGPEEREQIAEIVAKVAAAKPITKGEDTPDLTEADLETLQSEGRVGLIGLPIGFTVVYTREAQPAGLCHHISISIDVPGRTPTGIAVEMILRVFGMKPFDPTTSRVFLDEIGPGRRAVHVVQLVGEEQSNGKA